MQKGLFLILCLFSVSVNAQIVNIPDPNFKFLLLSGDVTSDIDGFPIVLDSNNDGEIQVTEAQAVYSIHLWQNNQYMVSDLTGIEGFPNLGFLNVDHHNISTLDLSGNPNIWFVQSINNPVTTINVSENILLEDLQCPNNSLTSIDVSNNVNLRNLELNDNNLYDIDVTHNPLLARLFVNDNQIASIDVSQNPILGALTFQNNLLTEIDVTNNPLLAVLYCQNNMLSIIDLSNNPEMDCFDCSYNTELEFFSIKNTTSTLAIFGFYGTPNLEYVCADDVEIDMVLNKISNYGYTGITVNTACNTLGLENASLSEPMIFPNPANANVTISNIPVGSTLCITDLTGSVLYESFSSAAQTEVNTSSFPVGIYMINISYKNEKSTKKLVITGN